MKKVLSLILATILCISCISLLAACGPKNIEDDLDTILNNILANADVDETTKEYFNYFLRDEFTPTSENLDYLLGSWNHEYKFDFSNGIYFAPMMSSQAFQLTLIKLPDASKAAEVEKELKDNFDMAKWVCVTPEIVKTTYVGDVVLLIAGDTQTVNALLNSFTSTYSK